MNLLLWTSHVTAEHFPLLDKLAACGYDGVEVPIFEGAEDHYKKLGEQLKRVGLQSSVVTVCGPDVNPASSDAAARAKALDWLKSVLDRSAALGADVIGGPIYTPLGTFTGKEPTEDEKKYAAETLRVAAEHAAKVNVRIAVEFLCRFETYFLNTARDTAALVKRIDHPSVGMLYDTFHANIEEKDPPGTLAETAGQLIHFHVSENDRGTPGSGHVQWRETFKALRRMKYDGWLTIEAFGRVLPELAAATRVWRDFFPSQEDVYERGIKFIRAMWDEAR
jgi:D-psicose/D-tagatose/L-ribulose 3-epimerase